MSSVKPNDSTRSLQTRERLHRPLGIELRGRQPAADVIDAESRHGPEDGVRVAVLRPGLHSRRTALPCRWRLRLPGDLGTDDALGQRADGNAASAGEADELASIHGQLPPGRARHAARVTFSRLR